MRQTFDSRWSALGLSLLVLFFCGAQTISGQEQRSVPIRIQDLLTASRFAWESGTGFSPDGRWFLYAIRNSVPEITARTSAGNQVPFDVRGEQIWISSTETAETRNITGGVGSNWAPSWSPDGRSIGFISDRDGSGIAKLWIWDSRSGRLQKVLDMPMQTRDLEWLPDARAVLVSLWSQDNQSETLLPEVDSKRLSIPVGSTARVYSARPPAGSRDQEVRSDPWSLDSYKRDLAVVTIPTGAMRVLATNLRVRKILVSPDGSAVAVSEPRRFESPGSQQILFNILSINLYTAELRTLASEVRLDLDGAALSWSPNGAFLSYTTAGMNEAQEDSFIVNTQGSPQARNVTQFAYEVDSNISHPHRLTAWAPVWSPASDFFYVVHDGALWKADPAKDRATQVAKIPGRRIVQLTSNTHDVMWSSHDTTVVLTHDEVEKKFGFYRVNLPDGRASLAFEKQADLTSVYSSHFLKTSLDGSRWAYILEDAAHGPDLWTAGRDLHPLQRLTRVNPVFDNYKLGQACLVKWNGLDGQPLNGALLLPSSYESGQKYPLLVWVYGGSDLSNRLVRFGLNDGYISMHNFQLFATRGYAVFLPAAPQSMGTPMLDLAKTILPGVQKVVDLGIADPARLVLGGHSYGGYTVLSLLVQTNRFKAAVSVDGFSNLITLYGQMSADGSAFETSVAESGQGLMGGSPWLHLDSYIENSPFFHLDRISTPLLLVHGEQDFTLSPYLSDELFVGMRRLGKKVEYVKYLQEDHSPADWSLPNQADYLNRILNWFESYLR